MPRRGRSTTVGKFAKFYQDRRVSEIRVLGELLRREQHAASGDGAEVADVREGAIAAH
ncbi:hypothetical protein [Micromonospora sp. CB01531]|uniref:hypothetical protein n=1 Tax=Micromonospora sp. CB01531 TaxID=1718947 RepID=UPI000A43B223|nr:hypothetical protein [Micromonospora sp. CB01531]